ncbi:MAG: hypothetical protein U9R79_00530 [Armatimonadota bacterium]|nr:hypothetical protein [Armatimonadota bacterium]
MNEDSLDHDPWTDLTWEDLEQWLGSKILGRGQSYHRNGRVVELARPDEHTLLARVSGTELYVTRVQLEPGELTPGLSYQCSCPYWAACKHAAAVVLEYLDRISSGEQIPEELSSAADAVLDADTWDDAEIAEADESRAERERMRSQYLDGLSRAELIDLIEELVATSADTRELLTTRAMLSRGETDRIVAAARVELLRVSEEPGWHNWRTGERHIPTYGRLRELLESLLNAGEADMVLELGEEILERGTEQVELSHDEGETATEVADCLVPVWKAIDESSLDPAERILWLIERLLEDEYDLCWSADEFTTAWDADADTWSRVADNLVQRLEECQVEDGDEWMRDYRRDRLSDWVLTALDGAGRDADALTLALREARRTGSYVRAVERLRRADRIQEARALAEEGIRETPRTRAGIASRLKEQLREIALQGGDERLAAAFAAQSFLRRPSLSGYGELRAAAEAIGAWEPVRRRVLDWLETGAPAASHPEWPLPETGLPASEDSEEIDAPACELLVQIALEEGDHRRAVAWYHRLQQRHPHGPLPWIAERVAAEAGSAFPDEAVAIWDELARAEIRKVNRGAYERSLSYLRPMQKLLRELGREDEWEAYLSDLREEHSRKRALQETLDRLQQGPIVGD